VGFVVAALPLTARAVDTSWDAPPATPGTWHTATNWNTDTVPGPTDNAFINNGGTAQITQDIPAVIDLRAGDGAGSSGTVLHSAGNATVNEWMRIGVNGGTGTYSLSGTGNLTVQNALNIGEAGTGTLNVSGGTLRKLVPTPPTGDDGDQWMNIGFNAGGNGTFNLSGGAVQVDTGAKLLIARNGGSGVVNHTGGTLNVRDEINIGDFAPAPGPTAAYNISAGTVDADAINVGAWNNANGTLAVSGTGQVIARNVLVVGRSGDAGVATGTVTQTGGTVTPTSLRIGVQGQSTTEIPAGTGGSNGTYTMSGGTLRQPDQTDIEAQGGWNHIGQAGPSSPASGSLTRVGTFNLSGGDVSFDTRTHIGSNVGAQGTVNQTGGTFEVRRHELVIGDTGTGVYNISAGTLRTLDGAHDMLVGHWDNSNGTLAVSGTGAVEVGANLVVGNGNPDAAAQVGSPEVGVVNQSGGSVRVTQNLLLAQQSDATGTYNLSGGTLDMTGGAIRKGAGTAAFNFTGGSLVNVATFEFPLTQGGGRLNPGPAPGPGATTVTGNYNLAAAGTLQVDITAPSGTDVLNVNGAVTLAGNLDIVPSGSLSANQSFLILQNDGVDPVTGAFLGRPQNTAFLEDGTLWRISYTGGDGNDVTLTVVPEPAALGLAALGACGLLLRRRRSSR
jgi:hypothetical protein